MKTIYIAGGKHFTPEIKQHLESIGFEPDNTDGDIVNSDFRLLLDCDAIYLANDWSLFQESVLAFKVARLHGFPCYKAQEIDLLQQMNIAIVELFGTSLSDIRKFNRKPQLTSVRTMYVGLAKAKGITDHLLTYQIQRQPSEIMHLQKKHKEFYKFDPRYRRMFDRMEDFLEFGIPKMVENYEQSTINITDDDENDNN